MSHKPIVSDKPRHTGRSCLICGDEVIVPGGVRTRQSMQITSKFCQRCIDTVDLKERERARSLALQEKQKEKRRIKREEAERRQVQTKAKVPSDDPYFCKLQPCRQKAVLDGWCPKHYAARHLYEI